MKLAGRFRPLAALWSIKDFRMICGSQVLDGLGEWLATMALIALVWARTHSALAAGVVLIVRILPAALLGTWLGVLVDRFNGKSVLVGCTAARACLYGALPLVSGIGFVIVLALLAEVTTIGYGSARDATLPSLVPKDRLPTANAISMGSSYGAMPLGSALYAVFALLGPHAAEAALATAALLTAGATVMVGRINAKACAIKKGERAENVSWRAGMSALREVFRADIILRRVAIGGLAAATGGGVVITLGQSYVSETLKVGAGGFGILLTSFCLGILAGVVALQKLRMHLAKVFMGGVAAMGAILLLMGLVPSTPIGVGMGFVFGGAFVVVFLGGITIMQERVHSSLRGRAFALAHSGLRVAAVIMGVLAAWGAKVIGRQGTDLGLLTLNGTQSMMALAGAFLTIVALMMLRRGAIAPVASVVEG